MSTERNSESVALVIAARGGEPAAQDALVSAYLPLVYNVVGRALNGSVDVDDVVQDTMLRALDALGGLRAPENFRSWLVAIAMNQVRAHWHHRQSAPGGVEEAEDLADPGADFVDLTLMQLQLSGQRMETARATRWLEPDDRGLLSLWWLECAGELTRSEVAEALELSPQHAAVRVQRMKAQLEAARVVVRALDARPRCEELQGVLASWDGRPSALWRKRIARHARGCSHCSGLWSGLMPAEGLLAGLALVAAAPALLESVLSAAGGMALAGSATQLSASGGHGRSGREPAPGPPPVPRRVDAAATAAGPSAAQSWRPAWRAAPCGTSTRTRNRQGGGGRRGDPRRSRRGALGTEPHRDLPVGVEVAVPSASPSKKASPSPSVRPTKKSVPDPRPSSRPTRTATSTPQTQAAPSGAVAQVVALVNKERSAAGCGPLSEDSELNQAALRHSEDMDARDFFDHTNPDGADPGQRVTAAGYTWSTYGENIAQGQQTPEAVMESWMNSPGHRANILNCSFKDIGVGIHKASGGPWWTQVFGAKQ
ncbi:sigma-70 family RNA polymerase sigma factor [Streptomyces sp. MS1.AVA.1]|uniref:RNA polymerase sigma factor n=1 Tax=Streptomyces machairae TaxID=3134109 RepID=A0ABU8UGN7_9ACTN